MSGQYVVHDKVVALHRKKTFLFLLGLVPLERDNRNPSYHHVSNPLWLFTPRGPQKPRPHVGVSQNGFRTAFWYFQGKPKGNQTVLRNLCSIKPFKAHDANAPEPQNQMLEELRLSSAVRVTEFGSRRREGLVILKQVEGCMFWRNGDMFRFYKVFWYVTIILVAHKHPDPYLKMP